MSIAVCNLSIVPLRAEASHRSEMVSQVLFGETFEILEEGIDFCHIRLFKTKYEGWIQKNQFSNIDNNLTYSKSIVDLVGATAIGKTNKVNLVHGTSIFDTEQIINNDIYTIEGNLRRPTLDDFDVEFQKLVDFYLNTPYMWGGRSNSGIDCSGLSQVFYAHFGIPLLRDAYQQAESGEIVNFLSEICKGDLAFFDNEAGRITHVGIMIDNETIIHASSRVRIDNMDNEGIFHKDLNRYTHKLRIVKRYF